MRLLVIIFCITGFLAKDIARLSWEIWFKVNQAEIIAEKCENKAIPMLHCNGKCYLGKKLKKLEEKEQQHNSKTNPFSLQKADWIFSHTTPEGNSIAIASAEPQKFTAHQAGQVHDYHSFIFHPPAV